MSNICPYPGLRPFNEDESIFFKGRETHVDEIISLLEKNKFLMVSGASGDGKSSLVYAGVIPNARGGFFKAKFNNWCVADFRPERNPLQNLVSSLSKTLKFATEINIEKEISAGFSSLVNLYKSSTSYLDTNSQTYLNADVAEQKKLKRGAANLLILVDQFEEFFTNSENYQNGEASTDSLLVVNLLLETYRIALAQEIPIYIVCTMRSDYIGQCAAFRGLPEAIGFSQFFVPRLKRKEIQQVIVEPALLSGNRISSRLTETLINELGNGFDQLPVLQHALNQIWKQAKNGEEEMDLLHLAQIAGLPNKQLNAEDRNKFKDWFVTVPEYRKPFFENACLENVLNAHANDLYNIAVGDYNKKHYNKFIDENTGKFIIKTAFQCLTKIDGGRAVRSRMTLHEITQIVNHPNLEEHQVDDFLDIFRWQGNTFLKPFIGEDGVNQDLKHDDVLDITHESLIRNWQLLKEWANEEYENWQTWQDFEKQLQRWIDSGKSKDFLLPIGPLTFFETWYNKFSPNKYWLSKYNDDKIENQEKINIAASKIDNANEYLRQSKRVLRVTRTVMKYGANKILATFGTILFSIAIIYYFIDYRHKQNDYVLEVIKQRGIDLLNSNYVNVDAQAEFILNLQLSQTPTTEDNVRKISNDTIYMNQHVKFDFIVMKDALKNLKDDTTRTDVAIEMLNKLKDAPLNRNANLQIITPYDLIKPIALECEVYLSQLNLKYSKQNNKDALLKRYNNYFMALLQVHKKMDKQVYETLIDNNQKKLYDNVVGIIKNSNKYNDFSIKEFNEAIEYILVLSLNKHQEADNLLTLMNPYSSDEKAVKRFNTIYAEDKKWEVNSYQHWNLSHGGGYQTLAYLNISTKNIIGLINSLDKVFEHNDFYKNYEKKYSFAFMSALYNNYEMVEECTQWIAQLKSETWLNVASKIIHPYSQYFAGDENKKIVLNIDASQYKKLAVLYEKHLNSEIKNGDELNFQLALLNKDEGIFYSEYFNDEFDAKTIQRYFELSFSYFQDVSHDYRNSYFIFYKGDFTNDNAKDVTNLDIYLYSYFVNYSAKGYHYQAAWSKPTYSNLFFEFLFNKVQGDKIALNNFEDAAQNYVSILYNEQCFLVDSAHNKIPSIIAKYNFNYYTPLFNLIKLKEQVLKNDTSEIVNRMNSIKTINNSNFQNSGLDENTFKSKLVSQLCIAFANKGMKQRVFEITKTMSDFQTRNILISVIDALQESEHIEDTFIYLDSLFKYIDKKPKFGKKLYSVLGKIGGNQISSIAKNLLQNETQEAYSYEIYSKAIMSTKKYYKALKSVPENLSDKSLIYIYSRMLCAHYKIKAKELTQIYLLDFTIPSSTDWINHNTNYESGQGGKYMLDLDE